MKKVVWWHMDSCWIPGRYDPSRIGPSIEAALRKEVGDGPTTVYAIGDTGSIPNRVLETLVSSGIRIRQTPFGLEDVYDAMDDFERDSPSPSIETVMMLIADPDEIKKAERRSHRSFEQEQLKFQRFKVIPAPCSWKQLLTTPFEEGKNEMLDNNGELAFCCTICERGIGSVHDFNVHLRSKTHRTKESTKRKLILARMPPPQTVVWWDIDSCPVPKDYDPRCVRPSIESALKKSVGSGHVHISAMGDTRRIPPLVFEALSSTGIRIVEAPFGIEDAYDSMHLFVIGNSPPATLMLITNGSVRFHSLLDSFSSHGYKIIRAYPHFHDEEWLWENLLNSAVGTNCESKREGSPLFCTVCDFDCSFLDDFYDHLQSELHEEKLMEKRERMKLVMLEDINMTVVWWDTDTCPVPDDCDSSCVLASIESAVKKSFGCGPITIYAVGDMKRVPNRLMLGLSLSGVLVKHHDFGRSQLNYAVGYWTIDNLPPANIMVISSTPRPISLEEFEVCGYRTTALKELLFVKARVMETTADIVVDPPPGEARWYCDSCDFRCDTYRVFRDHLYSTKHSDELSDTLI